MENWNGGRTKTIVKQGSILSKNITFTAEKSLTMLSAFYLPKENITLSKTLLKALNGMEKAELKHSLLNGSNAKIHPTQERLQG